MPGSGKREVYLSGSPTAIEEAKRLIYELLDKFEAGRNSGERAETHAARWLAQEPGQRQELVMLDNQHVPRVIGKGGPISLHFYSISLHFTPFYSISLHFYSILLQFFAQFPVEFQGGITIRQIRKQSGAHATVTRGEGTSNSTRGQVARFSTVFYGKLLKNRPFQQKIAVNWKNI